MWASASARDGILSARWAGAHWTDYVVAISKIQDPADYRASAVAPLRLKAFYMCPYETCTMSDQRSYNGGTAEVRQSPESWNNDGLTHCSYIVSLMCTSPPCRQNTIPGRRRCERYTDTPYRYVGFSKAHLSHWELYYCYMIQIIYTNFRKLESDKAVFYSTPEKCVIMDSDIALLIIWKLWKKWSKLKQTVQ